MALNYPRNANNPCRLYHYCSSGSASSIWFLVQELNEAGKIQLDFISEQETMPFKTPLETLIQTSVGKNAISRAGNPRDPNKGR